MRAVALDAAGRRDALDTLAATGGPGQQLDLLVVGGGVTGAGVALDATTRGLRTAVVEAQDWAAGTSSRSTKLVHGGLRYLQMLDFALVHEALTERDLLLRRIAPHLVRPMAFHIPLEHRVWQRAYYGAGVTLYDVLAGAAPGRRALPVHQHATRTGLLEAFPDLTPDAAVGAVKYWDATVDDARLVATLVRTAVGYGALAASRTQATALTRNAQGRVDGAVLTDLETGDRLRVHAREVVNATGVWTEDVEGLAGTDGGLHVLASKGVHLVVPRNRIRGETGLLVQTEKSVLFFVPWTHYWILGTTDTPWRLDPRHPVATARDIDYVLERANDVLSVRLTREDVVGSWAGLRPLLQPGTKEGTDSARVSREHTVASPTPGLTTIAGGKLTTYRVMARDAVDFVLGDRAQERPSITHDLPLLGAEGHQAVARLAERWARELGWTTAQVEHLLHRYGSMTAELVELVRRDPDLAAPLEHAPTYLRVEIAYACSHEGALHLEDVLCRRTRLTYEVADSGLAALPEIAAVCARAAGWDKERTRAEQEAYAQVVAAERRAALATDDETAVRLREQAGDVTPMHDLTPPAGEESA